MNSHICVLILWGTRDLSHQLLSHHCHTSLYSSFSAEKADPNLMSPHATIDHKHKALILGVPPLSDPHPFGPQG